MENTHPTSRTMNRRRQGNLRESGAVVNTPHWMKAASQQRSHPPGRFPLLGYWWVRLRHGFYALLQRVGRRIPLPEKEITRFLKFAMVGTLGAAIDFSLLNVFHFVFGWTKFWANTGSFSIAVCSNFLWNRYWTFPESRSRPVHKQLPMFFAVYVVGYFINQSVFLGSDAYLFSRFLPPALSVNLAKALANLVGLFWNFTANRFSTYRGL